jgi:hypothetical protein
MGTLSPFFSTLRSHGRLLLVGADDPNAELMALVWGPRFDREHARDLVQSLAPPCQTDLDRVVAQAADTFDRLPAQHQRRLRQAIRRHAGGTIRA